MSRAPWQETERAAQAREARAKEALRELNRSHTALRCGDSVECAMCGRYGSIAANGSIVGAIAEGKCGQ